MELCISMQESLAFALYLVLLPISLAASCDILQEINPPYLKRIDGPSHI